MLINYEDALKLPINTIIYSEVKRERYKIIYNIGKLVVKRIRQDNLMLEKKTKTLTKQDIEENYFKL